MNETSGSDRRRIASGLALAGIRSGAMILVHSSLRSLGHVMGGAGTVVQALLDAVGPEGTLLMPALSYDAVTPASPRFDARWTPSNVGAIPERFRTTAGVRRSHHPTHSVCGMGRHAGDLLGGHEKDRTPCGPRSPYRLLAERGGLIVFLGCGLLPNTSMHGVEELVEPPYLFRGEISFTVTREDGSSFTGSYRMHDFLGYRQRYDRIAQLDDGGWIRTSRVLDAAVHVVDAASLWRRAEERLRGDPLFFVEPEVLRPR